MRIRSIKPDFWRSEDISGLDWDARFIFIGLWSYVDDNGVGLDRLPLITTDLFADDVARDASETLARVSRGLQTLSDAGRITRYTVDGKQYLHITNWAKHQRIDRPNKPRYPLPTCENVEPRDTLAIPSRHSRDTPAPGTGEQGNRGVKRSSSNAARLTVIDSFDDFWDLYPRKVGKEAAKKAYAKALKLTSTDTILDAVKVYRATVEGKDPQFTAHPSTWLNQGRWADESPEPAHDDVPSYWTRTPVVPPPGQLAEPWGDF